MDRAASLSLLIEANQSELLADWLKQLKGAGAYGAGRIKDAELQTQASQFLSGFGEAVKADDGQQADGAAFDRVRALLSDISRARAIDGFSPSETAIFVFSLKEPLFALIQRELASDPVAMTREVLAASKLIDDLGLYTTEVYQKTRDDVIMRQQQEIAELSTPVVELWKGILALPLIGTLDSSRTQVVMENLLQAIVDQEAEIAIIDITGVPTVDTLVAQHLLKTIAAARLMGADCIISGIRPQIAQTMVHLGVELSVVSKASLADAFALALRRTDRMVAPRPGKA